MKYKITDECINCGACESSCPVNAIVPAGEKYEINDDCISCGACEGTCPVSAIITDSGEVAPTPNESGHKCGGCGGCCGGKK